MSTSSPFFLKEYYVSLPSPQSPINIELSQEFSVDNDDYNVDTTYEGNANQATTDVEGCAQTDIPKLINMRLQMYVRKTSNRQDLCTSRGFCVEYIETGSTY